MIGLNGTFCNRLGFNNCRIAQTKASVAGQDADRGCERVDIAFKLGTIEATSLRAKGRARPGRVKGSCGNGSLGEIPLAKSGDYRNIAHFLLLLLEEKMIRHLIRDTGKAKRGQNGIRQKGVMAKGINAISL